MTLWYACSGVGAVGAAGARAQCPPNVFKCGGNAPSTFDLHVKLFMLKPRPAGGGADSAPLSNIRDNLRTT